MFISEQCLKENDTRLNDAFWVAMASVEIEHNDITGEWYDAMRDLDLSYCGV